jgi:hypothetical protein
MLRALIPRALVPLAGEYRQIHFRGRRPFEQPPVALFIACRFRYGKFALVGG